jgi:hypothetical protein
VPWKGLPVQYNRLRDNARIVDLDFFIIQNNASLGLADAVNEFSVVCCCYNVFHEELGEVCSVGEKSTEAPASSGSDEVCKPHSADKRRRCVNYHI